MAASNSQDQDQLENELQKQTWWFDRPLQFHESFWCSSLALKGIIQFQTHFQAHDNDIILASLPKTGTIWLKSLLFFFVVNRKLIIRYGRLWLLMLVNESDNESRRKEMRVL